MNNGTCPVCGHNYIENWTLMMNQIDYLRTRIEAAEAYIQAMETRDAVEAQPECFPDEESYGQAQDDAFHAVCKAREAWEKERGDR